MKSAEFYDQELKRLVEKKRLKEKRDEYLKARREVEPTLFDMLKSRWNEMRKKKW